MPVTRHVGIKKGRSMTGETGLGMNSEMTLKIEVGPASGTGAWVKDLDFCSPKGIGSHQTIFN